MRMWMINPKLICIKHRVGEHGEIHKHRHIFIKHYSISGRVKPGNIQIEPEAMKSRHDELAKTFKNHNSPYIMPDLSYLPKKHREAKVDRVKSYAELLGRCPECRKLRGGVMENYTELKARQAKELNDFEGIFFAFNNEQFAEGMQKIGLTMEDKRQIYSLGAGGYIRKDKSEAFSAMFKRHREEKATANKEEKFLFDSLVYELNNHEYCITLDPADMLNALGYNKEDILNVFDYNKLDQAIAKAEGRIN